MMENKGVVCDVCDCRHNMDNCKCTLSQIKVTESCTCGSATGIETPHYCQSFEQK